MTRRLRSERVGSQPTFAAACCCGERVFESRFCGSAVSGNLDRGEFAVACEAMGFGSPSVVEVIFKSLDKDMSGEVSYVEMVESIEKEGCGDITLDAKRVLLALTWTASEPNALFDVAPASAQPSHQSVTARAQHGSDASDASGARERASSSSSRDDGGGPGGGPSQVELNKALVIQACRWRITGRDRAAEAEKSMADREAGEATAAYELVQLEKQLNEEKVAAARRAASTAVKRAAEADRALSAANRMKVRMELREHQAASGFTLADMIRLILDGEMREVCAQTFDTDLPHTRIDHADTARTPHVGLACVRYITAICPYTHGSHIYTLSRSLSSLGLSSGGRGPRRDGGRRYVLSLCAL